MQGIFFHVPSLISHGNPVLHRTRMFLFVYEVVGHYKKYRLLLLLLLTLHERLCGARLGLR